MRQVLVDHARGLSRQRRGGDGLHLSLDDAEGPSHQRRHLDLLILDEALARLACFDSELAALVELRFFGGLRHPEIAEVTGMPLRSVERCWALARAWLNRELDGETP